jgi:hypothetical protein
MKYINISREYNNKDPLVLTFLYSCKSLHITVVMYAIWAK